MKNLLLSLNETIDFLEFSLSKKKRKEVKEYVEYKRELIRKEYAKLILEEIEKDTEVFDEFIIDKLNVDKTEFLEKIKKEDVTTFPIYNEFWEVFVTKNKPVKTYVAYKKLKEEE